MNESHSAEAVANAFLKLARESGMELSNMKLQKLVYFAHGFSLALLKKPLIHNHVHAWQYGPVYPKLYKKLRKYGAGTVTGTIESEDVINPTSDFFSIIRAVWNAYSPMSAGNLSSRTHAPGTPWSKCWQQQEFSIIPDELIKAHFDSLLAT